MKNREITIAIATILGWHTIQQNPLYPNDENRLAGFQSGDTTALCGIPNYWASIDACRLFEEFINIDIGQADESRFHWANYERHLRSVTLRDGELGQGLYRRWIMATALQRCEAFLKLKGKWIETEEKG